MEETLKWWFMTVVVGLAALPMCLSLFKRLPDRGYALSKPFALILVGYVFWIFVIIGLPNSTRAIVFVLLLFFAASAFLLWRSRDEMLEFVRERWWLIGTTEILFFLAFITAAYLRSFVPDLGGTEKPMDFMFLNALTRAESFPPTDPWLAGEGVSYYYFGYLLVSIMTRLSSVATEIGYNLGLAMIASLAVTAAFGLVYNLSAPREERAATGGPGTPAAGFSSKVLLRPMLFGLAGALMLAVMGNLEGLLEGLASHGFGSNGFWNWIGINNLTSSESIRWFPDQFWFWWRATRVIEVSPGLFGIHEFPFFSFLLGDLHPHVMSIPFVLLVVGAALALLRSDSPLDIVVWLERPLWLVAYAVMLGGLAFLNTWDMPTMAFIIVLVTVIRNRLIAPRWSWGLLLDSAGFLMPLFLVAFLAYTPFFFGGFDSQASGFSAAVGEGTRLLHTFLLWGAFAVLVLPYAVWRILRNSQPITLASALGAIAPFAIVLFLWVIWDLLTKMLGFLPAVAQLNDVPEELMLWDRIENRGISGWLSVLVMGGSLSVISLALFREIESAKRSAEERISHVMALALSATAALLILGSEFIFIQDQFSSRMNTVFKLYYQAWLFLSLAGGFVLYEIASSLRLPRLSAPRPTTRGIDLSGWSLGEYGVLAATLVGAIAGVIIIGIVMTSSPLTQILGAVLGAGVFFVVSGLVLLIQRGTSPQSGAPQPTTALTWQGVWAGAAMVVLSAAFVYPVLATWNRTDGCVAHPVPLVAEPSHCGDVYASRSLDGLVRVPADEVAAIEWLRDLEGQPVIAEALGDAYTDGGRISASTGLPSPLQWLGHQKQWRGADTAEALAAGRPEDLETLYTSSNVDAIRSVVDKYGIEYVYLGQRERTRYGELALPSEVFEPKFDQGSVIIYRVRTGIVGEARRE